MKLDYFFVLALGSVAACSDPSGTGGRPAIGGSTSSGGNAGSGGSTGNGGAPDVGGGTTGGAIGTGGVIGSGGTSPSGGSSGAGTGGDAAGGAGSGGTAGGGGAGGTNGADPNFMIFLLIGQSNMEGVPAPAQQDQVENPRVKVLAYNNCQNLNRTYNQWYTARPPLHSCYAGLGPGDYFGKTLADAFPNATIGLVPNAISGVDIDFFRKGVVSSRRNEFQIPPDNHWSGAYEWVIERAQLAQQSGVIRGIIFHQGESDMGQAIWVEKVKGMVTDLRADLGIGEVPFIAGELLYSCCAQHNPYVNELPGQISNSFVVSANGLNPMDQYHFDLAGQRELGNRYGQAMLDAL